MGNLVEKENGAWRIENIDDADPGKVSADIKIN
jgi:hypothetical protein